MFSFRVTQADGKARLGLLATDHGEVATPAFMAVGTAGSVKGVAPDRLRAAGAQIILANAYHLMLRPGPDIVRRTGGVHKLMAWPGPILTDSGGYQVFSLARLRKIDDEAVIFQSHIDGAEVVLGPERAVEVQRMLGADIMMQLDECPPADATKDRVATAVRRSAAWARRCKAAWQSSDRGGQVLFAIQQGRTYADLRAESAGRIVELDLPGYAIGGLGLGEGHHAMIEVLDAIDAQLPAEKPRYLMGLGEPKDIIAAVMRGIDMFDSVLPTRNGRNGQAYTFSGKLRLRNARWAEDARPLEDGCDCYTCRNFSRSALRHLFMAREMLAPMLTSIHNLRFYMRLMSAIRRAISAGSLRRMAGQWLTAMYAGDNEDRSAGA